MTISIPSIQAVVDQIAALFQPDKIILFGSYAYGQPHEGSDVDLLVVLPFEGRAFTKSLEILKSITRPFGIDLIVKRPEEVENRYKLGDPLIQEACERGKVLYERHRSGMV